MGDGFGEEIFPVVCHVRHAAPEGGEVAEKDFVEGGQSAEPDAEVDVQLVKAGGQVSPGEVKMRKLVSNRY